MFLLLKPSDLPFHSPASLNVISIAGIPTLHTLVVARSGKSGKLCGRQEQLFVNRICMKFEYITKVSHCTFLQEYFQVVYSTVHGSLESRDVQASRLPPVLVTVQSQDGALPVRNLLNRSTHTVRSI